MSNTYYLNYLANVEMSINYTDNPISLRSQFYMIYQNSATFNLFGMESNFSVPYIHRGIKFILNNISIIQVKMFKKLDFAGRPLQSVLSPLERLGLLLLIFSLKMKSCLP